MYLHVCIYNTNAIIISCLKDLRDRGLYIVTSLLFDTSLSVNKMATYCLTVARLQVRDGID